MFLSPLYFFYLQTKSVITFERLKKSILSDVHGLEIACDDLILIRHFVFSCVCLLNSKHKINHCQEKSHVLNFQ